MATISTIICASHSPYLYAPPEDWNAARVARDGPDAFAADLPIDSEDENRLKHSRCMRAFEVLKKNIADTRPDVLIIFGDDQLEQFNFSNYPAFCIFVGEEFSGYRISQYFGLPVGGARPERPKTPEHWATVKGHPELARQLMTGLVARGFDMSFSETLNGDGVGHAFMRPLEYLVPDFGIPTIPIYINCYYGPQPTAARCRALGAAIREIVEGLPSDLRVGVIGSGGLWHTPLAPLAHIDKSFDAAMLAAIARGDAVGMAAEFDSRAPSFDPSDPDEVRRLSGGTGMVLGYGSGTGETRNWIAANAVADGAPGTVVDYVEINASPVGAGFAYWNLGR